MTSQKFAVDQLVLESASVLTPAHFESFSRLCKKAVYGPDFQLLLIDCRDQLLQQQLQKLLSAVCQKAGFAENQLSLGADIPDVFELQQHLQQLALSHSLIQLTHAAAWFNAVPDGKRWQDFNLLRENIAQSVNCKLVLWLDETAITQMINQAPDWWAWRSGVYTFSSQYLVAQSPPKPNLNHIHRSKLNKTKVAARITELRSWLSQYQSSEPEIAGPLAMELGLLYQQIGKLDHALSVYEYQCLPLFTKLDNRRAIATIYSYIADIKEARGELNEVLDIRQNLELPVHQRLADTGAEAMTKLKIADAYVALGKLDKALDLLMNECLPTFQKLGDTRDIAFAYDRIADIKHMQKDYDAELSIRLTKVLPVFKDLSEVREIATVQSKIAEIMVTWGKFDDALRIYLDICVPSFERLGDAHHLAISKANIARIWMIRGRPEDVLKAKAYLDEALDVMTQANYSEAKSVKLLQDKYF